eukprot:365693-Chlamydomonas_euryale.AAC.24
MIETRRGDKNQNDACGLLGAEEGVLRSDAERLKWTFEGQRTCGGGLERGLRIFACLRARS